MTRMIIFLVFVLLPFFAISQEPVKLPDSTQNAAKRFTLQDLLSQQQEEKPKTQAVDIGSLIAAAQNAAQNQQQASQVVSQPQTFTQQFSGGSPKDINIDVQPDKNGNINLDDIPGMLSGAPASNDNDIKSAPSLSDLLSQQRQQASYNNHVVHEELDVGKEKIELEAAGKRTTHYTLARGRDGGLNLIPVVEGANNNGKLEILQPKGYQGVEKGKSRQEMQLTTLSQALYSPFPSDQNILHLHLKGKDGHDGKPGNKGPMGSIGPKGPEGPRGPKGDAGTCSAQINGLFECTPDELDSLSNRIDYLEKICKKVENSPTKKHKVISNNATEISQKENSTKIDTNSKNATHSEPKTGVQRDRIKQKYKKNETLTKSDDKETKSDEKETVKNSGKDAKLKVDEKEEALDDSKNETAKQNNTEDAKAKDDIKPENDSQKDEKKVKESESKKENADSAKDSDIKTDEENKVKEEVVVNKQKEKTEKVQEEKQKEKEKIEEKEKADGVEKIDTTAEKKQIKKEGDDEKVSQITEEDEKPKKVWHDPANAKLRSMIDIKAKLKIAELDLMDRVKEAKNSNTGRMANM